MNIYEKLQKVRVELQEMNLKKSGENTYAKYKYYELGDILPAINKLLMENKMTAIVKFDSEYARLRIVNCEKPDEEIEFTSPMAEVTLKGAHDIQNLGAVETYQRRYLYMMAFEVVESDFFDATQGKEQAKQPQKPKTQNKAPQSKLSTATVKSLNDSVREYARLTGLTNESIMAAITNKIGKEAKDMTEQDGKQVLALLMKWQEEYLTSNVVS